MAASDCAYKWEDFLGACRNGVSHVFVTASAMETARRDFKLKSQAEVLAFIANGGLEDLRFFNCKDWKNNRNVSTQIKADAYHFSAGRLYGYLAYCKAEKWIIKSMKKETQDPRNLPFADLAELLRARSVD